jgi:dTDP-4-amino-4,6-dideoxygalactose transaminase
MNKMITNKQQKVNFIDLKAQYQSIKPEINEVIQSVLDSTSFTGGPFVRSFEEAFANAHDAKYCVTVSNGTAALHIMMLALEFGSGDEIIVPANTFFATAEAVSLCGATPVFVDCEKDFYNMDPAKLEAAINKNTKAILVVHLYGQPAQVEVIKEIADRHNITLLEDCAQAHLASLNGNKVGTFGLAGSFSFYPGKNLGAYGEGGSVVTNDQDLYEKMQIIKDHGSRKKYYHDIIGHNYRLEAMQCAILEVKLKHLPKWTEKRNHNAQVYREQLKGFNNIILPQVLPGAYHSYHLFVVRVPSRDKLAQFLLENGVYTGIHYPIPCHLQKAYEHLGYAKGSFPLSEKYAQEILSLPMSEQLTENEILYIRSKMEEYFG